MHEIETLRSYADKEKNFEIPIDRFGHGAPTRSDGGEQTATWLGILWSHI